MRGIGETLAFNPIPQLFKPMYELGANKNLFTGNPIVNLSMSGLEYPYQSSPWTSPVATRIGQAMPEALGPAQSPLRVQHTIRAYTGTVGLYTLNAVDWILRQADGDLPDMPSKRWYEKPVINRIVKGPTDTTRYNRYKSQVYELIDESNKAQRTFNLLAKQGRIDEAKDIARKRKPLVNTNVDPKTGQPEDRNEETVRSKLMDIQKSLREMNAKERAIMASKNIDGDKKREMLDTITRTKNKMLSNNAKLLQIIEDLKE